MNLSPAASTNTPAALRRKAFALLWLALFAQAVWMLFHHLHLHESWASMSYPLMYAVPFLLLPLTNARVRRIASMLPVPPAFAFLAPAAVRLSPPPPPP